MKGTGEGASGTHPGRIASRDFRERVPRTPRAAPAGQLRACPLGTPSLLPLPTEPPQPPLRSPGRAPAALRAPGAPSTVSARSPGAAGRPPPGAGPGWAPGPPRSARPSLALHRPTRASRSPCPLRSLSAPPAPCARTPALLRAAAAGFHSEETETGRTGRGCNGPSSGWGKDAKRLRARPILPHSGPRTRNNVSSPPSPPVCSPLHPCTFLSGQPAACPPLFLGHLFITPLFFYSPFCLFVHFRTQFLCVCPFIYPSIRHSVFPPIHPAFHPSSHSMYLSFLPFTNLSSFLVFSHPSLGSSVL